MLVDVFFKNEDEDITRTVWLGTIEIEDSAIEALNDEDKKIFIEATIASSISSSIEWTPISETLDGQKNIKVEFEHDTKLN